MAAVDLGALEKLIGGEDRFQRKVRETVATSILNNPAVRDTFQTPEQLEEAERWARSFLGVPEPKKDADVETEAARRRAREEEQRRRGRRASILTSGRGVTDPPKTARRPRLISGDGTQTLGSAMSPNGSSVLGA